MLTLAKYLNALAIQEFGMTTNDAHENRICIKCKQMPILRSKVEADEYRISGLCGLCFEEITKEAEE